MLFTYTLYLAEDSKYKQYDFIHFFIDGLFKGVLNQDCADHKKIVMNSTGVGR